MCIRDRIMIDFQHYFIDEFESLLVKSSFQKWMNNLRPFLIFMTRTYKFFLVFFFLSYVIDSVFNFHWYRVSGKSRLFCQFFGNVSFTWLLKVLPVSVSLGKLPMGLEFPHSNLRFADDFIYFRGEKKFRLFISHLILDEYNLM